MNKFQLKNKGESKTSVYLEISGNKYQNFLEKFNKKSPDETQKIPIYKK